MTEQCRTNAYEKHADKIDMDSWDQACKNPAGHANNDGNQDLNEHLNTIQPPVYIFIAYKARNVPEFT